MDHNSSIKPLCVSALRSELALLGLHHNTSHHIIRPLSRSGNLILPPFLQLGVKPEPAHDVGRQSFHVHRLYHLPETRADMEDRNRKVYQGYHIV